MALFAGSSPQRSAAPKEENTGGSKLIRVFGIARGKYTSVLKNMLNSTDINCMGVLPPVEDRGSIEDTVSKVAAMPLDAVVFYAPTLDQDIQKFMQIFKKSRQGVAAVFLTDKDIDVDLLQTAMSCGINKVSKVSEDNAELVQEIVLAETRKNIVRTESAEILKYKSRVIVTYSSKGGAGKTTVAVNLAAALSQKGNKVTIIDLDLAAGDIHSFLNVDNKNSISELAEEPVITPNTIKSYVTQAANGIGVICAPAAPQHANVVSPDLVSRVITTLRAENDYIVIDCDQQLVNGSIAKCIDEAMKAADIILFIVTPEIPTINGANDMLHKYLDRDQELSEKIRIVVNKAGSASTITSSEISRTLDKPIFMSIPDDYGTVVQSSNTGIPFMYQFYQNGGLKIWQKLHPILGAYDQLSNKIVESC